MTTKFKIGDLVYVPNYDYQSHIINIINGSQRDIVLEKMPHKGTFDSSELVLAEQSDFLSKKHTTMQSLQNVIEHLKSNQLFLEITKFLDKTNWEVYVVGGYCRDLFLNEISKDIDLVVIGSGIKFANEITKFLNISEVNYFENFGTANFKYGTIEVEIVGARKESYVRGSRKPIVEDGTLYEDLSRRDTKYNAIAISLNTNNFGEIIDPYKGLDDINNRIIQTPLAPHITINDDPLRSFRYIRQACKFGFTIEKETYQAIKNNVDRIEILSQERIVQEVNKILLTKKPSIGFKMLQDTGLLKKFLPELSNLDDVQVRDNKKHKNNFLHTIEVVDQVRQLTDDLQVLWASVLHDIGKVRARAFDGQGWTFHNHEEIGAKMISRILNRLKLPVQDWENKIITITRYHGRVKELALDETSDIKISDAAIRRLIVETGDHLNDLLLFVKCDMTTKYEDKRQKYLHNYALLEKRIQEIAEKDHLRNFKLPISGNEIMETFNIGPSRPIGQIKEEIKNAILDGKIPNEKTAARNLMMEIAGKYLNNKS